MSEWLEDRSRLWLRRHAIIAPFGITAATAALVYLSEPGPWSVREVFRLAASLVDLAAVLYAMVAVLAEQGVNMIWWALEQRRKRREERERLLAEAVAQASDQARAKALAEGRAEGQAAGRVEGQAEILTLIRDEVRTAPPEEIEERLERIAQEKGIHLNGRPDSSYD